MLAQHRNATNEQYTPQWLIVIAQALLDGIELDPASSRTANKTVRAKTIFTQRQNGLRQSWRTYRTVWLNPPGGVVDEDGRTVIRASKEHGRQACSVTGACGLKPGHKHEGVTSSAARWWNKLSTEWWGWHRDSGTAAALFLGFSLELLQTAQRYVGPHPLDFTGCVFADRLEFDELVNGKLKKGTQPTHASMLVLLTKNQELKQRFALRLKPHGKVYNP